MRQDDLAQERGDQEAETWERSILKAQVYRDIGCFINKYRPGGPVELHSPIRGGYNISCHLEYKDGSSAALRIPCKEIVKCPHEKVRYEVATMRYIAEKPQFQSPRSTIRGLCVLDGDVRASLENGSFIS